MAGACTHCITHGLGLLSCWLASELLVCKVDCRDGRCLTSLIFHAVCMSQTSSGFNCTERLANQAVMPYLIRLSKNA